MPSNRSTTRNSGSERAGDSLKRSRRPSPPPSLSQNLRQRPNQRLRPPLRRRRSPRPASHRRLQSSSQFCTKQAGTARFCTTTPTARVCGVTPVKYMCSNTLLAGWTKVPGQKMEHGTGKWDKKMVLQLEANRVEFVATNGHDWDSPDPFGGNDNYLADVRSDCSVLLLLLSCHHTGAWRVAAQAWQTAQDRVETALSGLNQTKHAALSRVSRVSAL